jgi:circadian clock protein KaiC
VENSNVTSDGRQEHAPLPRIPTGVPGMDQITGGGLLKSGVYILQGTPGAGKTLFANQVCFNHARQGGQVVYVTMLAESHARLFQHLQTMSFYDPGVVPERVYYVSGFNALRDGGLPAVLTLLRSEMRAHKAGVLVLDGLVMAATAAASEQDLKLFASEIQAHSVLTGCTTLLLTSDEADQPVTPEQTMVDGIFLLRDRPFGAQRERNIEVRKFRGSATLRGNHSFRIGPDGLVVFPRVEAAHRESPGAAIRPEPVSSGVDGLDRMIGLKGLPRGSVTAVSGFGGSGKTVLALHFASRASVEQPCVYLGFFESPEFLLDIGDLCGLGLRRLHEAGALHFLWRPFGENILDELTYDLLGAVKATKAGRVVIDSAGGFQSAPAYNERGGQFFSTLANELRRMGVTTVLTVEETRPDTWSFPVSTPSMSALCDNIVYLSLAGEDETKRFATIGKVRSSRFDSRRRELVLTERGLRIDRRGPDDRPPDSPPED